VDSAAGTQSSLRIDPGTHVLDAPAEPLQSPARLEAAWHGPLATVLGIGLLELLARTGLRFPEPGMLLLLPLAFTASSSSAPAAAASLAAVLGYRALALTGPAHPAAEELQRFLALALSAVALVVLLRRVRARLESAAAAERRLAAETAARADRLHDEARAAQAEVARLGQIQGELRKQARELEAADHRKNELMAMLGHELRNPLSAVISALELLRRAEQGSERAGWALDVLSRQVRHMSRLVDDLLDVSRITRGKIELRLEPLALSSVVARALEQTRRIFDERGHRLEVRLPEAEARVLGDPARLAQVLTNLLTNAAKYTEPGGRIELAAAVEEAGPEAQWVEICVRDDGMGIPGELLPRVFDLFTQGDRSLGRSRDGLGIGLALVRSLVELHGGSVHASSGGPGLGSELRVRLPRLPAQAAPLAASAPPFVEAGDDPRRRILLVEDHLDAAHGLRKILELWGHEVRLAYRGPEALELVPELDPEVVLLDLGLPEMDGYEVARRLRRLPGTAGALLVALTGHGREDDVLRSKAAGFDHHVVKPVDLAGLRALLGGAPRPGAGASS
jgi:signal transduction histidine kinase